MNSALLVERRRLVAVADVGRRVNLAAPERSGDDRSLGLHPSAFVQGGDPFRPCLTHGNAV
jgi:hypothetical protein